MTETYIIHKLYDVLKARKSESANKSYVASLYAKGTAHICDKVMEEAQETIDEALAKSPTKLKQEKLRQESADLLFHLMVLWADQNITPDDVFEILSTRFGISGHDEKDSRST